MPTGQMSQAVQQLRRAVLWSDGAGLSDAQLLDHFIERRDEAAFETLVRRHGPMVLGVCRRLLRNYHDADDAFQATFLVLVRKAASIAPREMVANWLYGVACQTALKGRAVAAKRQSRERQVTVLPERETLPHDLWVDLQPILDQELSQLPDKYRVPVLLCDLEGKTYKEAARQLRWPEGTLSVRLARARKMLAKRLTRHGFSITSAALAAVVSGNAASACVLPSLASSTIKAASVLAAGQAGAGVISAKVAALTEGVLKTMLLTKVKTVMAVFITISMVGLGGGALSYYGLAVEQESEKQAVERAKEEAKTARTDKEKLQGTWKVVSLEVDGTNPDQDALLHSEPVRAIQWTFSGNKIAIRGADKSMEADYTLDATETPKRIDLNLSKQVDDLEVRVTALGICKLERDTLTVCFAENNLNDRELVRPLKFETKKGGTGVKVLCYALQREVPAKKDQSKNEERFQRFHAGGFKSMRGFQFRGIGKPEDADAEGKMLRGVWTMISSEVRGQPEGAAMGAKHLFENGMILIQSKEGMEMGAYRLDPTRTPKTIDLIPLSGPNKDKVLHGIYELQGKQLKICLEMFGKERPAKFETNASSDYELDVFKRGNGADQATVYLAFIQESLKLLPEMPDRETELKALDQIQEVITEIKERAMQRKD